MHHWRTVSVLLIFGAALPAAAATNTVVSAPASAPSSGAAGSYVGSFSPDGRFLLFYSHANNLATNDDNKPFLDVFARDLSNGLTTLVSVGTNGRTGGDDNSPFAMMSTNGFVAFESRASNLATNDTNGLSDVFVRNLSTRATTLVSVNSNGTRSALGRSTTPLISQDGRRVIFESTATNLAAGESNGFTDIYVRDLIARTTTLVSRDATNVGFAQGPSEAPSISADGRYVAFAKGATNFLPSNRQSIGEIYVRDLDAGTTIWASADANTNFFATSGYPYRFYSPVLSADGRYVAFFGEGPFASGLFRRDLVNGVTVRLAINVTNAFGIPMSADGKVLAWIVVGGGFTPPGLRVWDEDSGTNVAVSIGNHSAMAPVLSADGNRLAWFTNNIAPLVFFAGLNVFDRATGSNQLISLTTNGTLALPTEPSVPAISPDGRFVAFETDDPRLAAGDENAASDVFVRDIDSNTTELVSAALPERPAASATGMASLGPGALSADGRFLVFTALDGNLVPGDTNRQADVFVRDLMFGGLIAASASTVPAPGGGTRLLFQTNEFSCAPVISGDGRVVAYRGWKPWLPNARKLYWRELAASEPVPVFSGGVVTSTNTVTLNHDGRLLAFDSDASPATLAVSPGTDFNTGSDVYLRDIEAGTNALISVNLDGTGSGNGVSMQPVFSPDGNWLAFLSRATDLTTNTVPGTTNAFVRHLPSGRTRLLSHTNLPGYAQGPSYGLGFSEDSRYLFFGIGTPFMLVTNVYRHDLSAATTTLVCGGCQNPAASGDGRFVAYDSVGFSQFNFTRQISCRDLVTDYETVISVRTNSSFPAFQDQSVTRPMSPQISRDGRYVVWFSTSPELAPTDTNRLSDLFARDRLLRRTYHLTVNMAGTTSANGISSSLQMSGDGRSVVIQSHANDLAPGDYNFRRDIFVLRLGEPDGDGDGMDDDWEMAYFSTLARDGTGDFDGDGASDRHEFGAGTDPTNTGSIFRVLSLSQIGGAYALFWGAVPGAKYQVQYRDLDTGAAWINRGSPVTATSTTGSLIVQAAATVTTNRFYRVVLLR